MNSIIITSIICVSFVIVTAIICYSNWRNKNGDELKYIHKRIDCICSKINDNIDINNKLYNKIIKELNKI